MKEMGHLVRRRAEQGFTLLEYCAGAAIIAGIVWGAMTVLGQNLGQLITTLAEWVGRRSAGINQN